MNHITVNRLTRHFGRQAAVDDVSFQIESGKLIGLLGPSGGGKTTILRMLAGLEQPDSGEIRFHGRRVNEAPPQERGIGFVFQNYALFKHMSVYDNIAFGLTLRKKARKEIAARVEELIELTGLSGLGKRLPHQLSGGQRQRVAFARAIAPEPQLLLLDEPFAAIDAKVRKELRTWLKEMIDRVKITTIFVTHDQEEAVEVADEIMVINQGKLEQKGTPWEIYKEPQSPFVAAFIGESSVVDDVSRLKGFEMGAPGSKGMIRPEFIDITKEGEPAYSSAADRGLVRSLYFRGTSWQVEVETGSHRLLAYRSLEQPAVAVGEEVGVLIHRIYVFDGETGAMLENARKADPMPVYI
ncbi:sulfate ABC transporter ATP-binding protein [Paenibacillus aurantius]|uniref:Carnitine transport ATP-binding protein OpuCA n=1 Tax=Paenibacillus aurantius TaxID=2918900 RepID=A0AA96LBX7_9BACL|nr:sulfate ABC transporter ATP-binding protein [Paenibacillus aurantius]WNQ10279.1 sulfate ABC transporter ATP-binding protein [Paenibacillus aurantius]